MKIRLIGAAVLAVALPFGVPGAATAATLQVTPGVPSSTSTVRAFAPGGFTGPFGQSFTSIDSSLNSIGFQFVGFNPGSTGQAYTLSLFAGETLTGTSLVTRTFTLPTTITTNTPTWFDVDIGAVAATVGQRYTAVLSSSDIRNGIVLGPNFSYAIPPNGGQVSGDTYAGGRFFSGGTAVYPDCPNNATSPCDLNFRVTGTTVAAAVPEPASWALMVGGFGLMGGIVRRRQRATTRAFA